MRPRGRPVDLVGQDDVGEDRSRPEAEIAQFLIEEGDATDVGREQIGSELDASALAANGARQRPRQRRLANARHVFDQDVAFAEHGDEQALDHLGLADDDPADVRGDSRRQISDRAVPWSHPHGSVRRRRTEGSGFGAFHRG